MDFSALALLGTTFAVEEVTGVLVLAGIVVGGVATWAETRFHVGGLREANKTLEAKVGALETRLAAAEVREGRTLERLDYFANRLDRIDGKLDRILDQSKGVA